MDVSISPWVAEQIGDVEARARRWIEAPELKNLMRELGGPRVESIGALVEWTSRMLDTRAGAERRDSKPIEWNDEFVNALLAVAGPNGLMVTPTPQLASYDDLLVLGGTTLGNELRTALAESLMKEGIWVGEIVGLTADRVLGASEQHSREGISTEWEHLLRCLDSGFGPLASEGALAGGIGAEQWMDHRYRGKGGRAVRLLVAPPVSSSRPSTPEAISFFLNRYHDDLPKSVLIVTSAIYIPYQFFAAAGALVNGGISHVEFVGTPTSTSGDRGLLSQRVAQEVHAAVVSVARLLGA
jgi:hypothetical protein